MSLKYDPEFAEAAGPILTMMASAPKPAVHDIPGRRELVRVAIGGLMSQLPQVADVDVKQHKIKSFDGAEIEVYHIKKQGTEATTPGPAILHIHGGGMFAGDTATFDWGPKSLSSMSGVQFFDVEYRLAPEKQGTSLVEDCYAALLWLHENATSFGVDKSRIGVMGESAGGGIAAGVTLMARDKGLQPPLAKSILVYPMLDHKNTKPVGELENFLVWDVDGNITGWTALLGDKIGTDDVSPYCSPSYAKDVSGLPSTYIDCGTLDLFLDEDKKYAKRLADANVDVTWHEYPGVPHAFEGLAPNISLTQEAGGNRLKAVTSF